MTKEIIIAAFEEEINWIEDKWRPYTTIYRCGSRILPINPDKFVKRHNYYRNNNPIIAGGTKDLNLPDLNQIKELINYVDQLREMVKERSPSLKIFREKSAKNAINSREAEQWLNHIIWNYDNLADTTIFLQGHPHDHCPDFLYIIENISSNTSFINIPATEPCLSNFEEEDREIKNGLNIICNSLQIPKQKEMCWTAGAQFAISKSNIRKRSLNFYKNLQIIARDIPRSGEILERFWWNIFGCPPIG